MRAKDSLGRHGEDLAVKHLQDQGMQVLERNWRCATGEIDVVALDGDCVVICEVKTRRSLAVGSPLEAVTWTKLGRLRQLTALWLRAQERPYREARIDVIGILLPRDGSAVLEQITVRA